MAKDKPEELSRRDFLGATIGAAVAVGVGCAPEANNPTNSTPGQSGGTGNGGTADQDRTGQGGSSTPGQGGTTSDQRDTSTGQGGASEGGGSADTSEVSETKGGASTGRTRTTRTSDTGGSGGNGGTAKTDVSSKSSGGTTAKSSSKAETTSKGGTTAKSGSTATGGTSAGGGASSSGSNSAGTALVAMVRGTDWVQATMDAIELAGGLPDLSGKTVVLKPNIISSDKNATSSVEVIHGVVRAAKAKNAAKIIVADAGWGSGASADAGQNMKALGITDMCATEGAEVLDLRNDSHTTRKHANASAFPNGIDFSDTVYNAGYVINIPVCKSHAMGKFSMALKAWYGCTEQGRPHGNTWVAPAELHLFRQEDFVVLDATKCMITGGPSSGTMAQSKIVVASKDAIVADVTGLCIHKHNGATLLSAKGDAWKIHQIKRALALKFPGWVSSPVAFEYVQEGVTEHEEIMSWRMA